MVIDTQAPEIDDATVVAIVCDIMAGLFGEFSAAPTAWSGAAAIENYQADVRISGAWNGGVSVRCSQQLAATVAAKLMMLDAADLSADDTSDALGEFVNIVGGNIKSVLPGPSALSLPEVVLHDTASAPSQTREVTRVQLCWAAEPFTVAIWSGPSTEGES